MEKLSDNVRIPRLDRNNIHQDVMEIPTAVVAKTSGCTSQKMDLCIGKQSICSRDRSTKELIPVDLNLPKNIPRLDQDAKRLIKYIPPVVTGETPSDPFNGIIKATP